MKLSSRKIPARALACALVAAQLSLHAAAAPFGPATRPAATSQKQDPDPRRCAEDRDHNPERCIAERDEGQNGITVGEPKVYDDALLHQMLRAAEARLATLQVFDQAAILTRLGAVTGASQQISSFGLNVQGAPVPGVTTATTLPTLQTTQTTAAGAADSSLTTVSGLGTQNVTTTQPSFSPPTAPAPPPSTTFPTGFSVSASDILNEQTQLAAEINGLRLLLAGSLSDFYVKSRQLGSNLTRYKTTLGFPIAVSPGRRYKDAVAVVEVEVLGSETLDTSPSPPAVTAIIPRDKTYNVAAITDKSTSIGGGVATQLVGVSANWFSGRKTYYLVQDQDTVALTYRPADGNKSGFRWQFRPVLGQSYVKAGLKQTFVQLAFNTPPDPTDGEIGRVSVRTYWRKYDRKTGVVGDLIRGSYREMYRGVDIPRYRLVVRPGFFNPTAHLEDLGGGQLLVKLPGRFLPGTTVRIGATTLTEGPRFKHEHQGILFTASASELATRKVSLVAHDGTEVELRFDNSVCTPFTLGTPKITPVDDANSRVSLPISPRDVAARRDARLVFIIGARAFGYSDAPLRRDVVRDGAAETTYLSAVVPNALLMTSPELRVQPLLAPEGCGAPPVSLAGLQPSNQGERLVLLEQGAQIKFLLYGSRLSSVILVLPEGATLGDIGDTSNADWLRVVTMSPDKVTSNKQILLRRPGEQPFLVTVPELAPKKPDPPKSKERVTVGSDEALIVGDGMKELEGVTFREQKVSYVVVDDKNLRLTGLRTLGATSEASTQRFLFKFKAEAKPKEVDVEVINTKVETLPK